MSPFSLRVLAALVLLPLLAPPAFAADARLMEDVSYEANKPAGTWTSYFKNGHKATTITYVNGLREGHWTKWYDNGRIQEEGDFHLNKLSGTWHSYFKDGRKATEMHYLDGLKDGAWTKWYDNGQVEESGTFHANKLTGRWLGYFKDGSPAQEHYYQDGLKVGHWRKWYGPASAKNGPSAPDVLNDEPTALDFEPAPHPSATP